MRKKSIFTILIIVLMAFCCAAGNLAYIETDAPKKSDGNAVVESSRELTLFNREFEQTQEQATSRIKAEYLKKNGGYRANDKVVAIISLDGDAVIDEYFQDADASENMTVAEYAATYGKSRAALLGARQRSLISVLEDRELIHGVNNKYTTVMNAVSVEVDYGNIEKIEALDGVESVILSDTYNRPQAAETDEPINTVINDVDVYDTGIFDSSSVSDLGITGKGTAVAVLDSGFDCSHEVFAAQPRGELWINKGKVEELLPQTNAAHTTEGLKLTDVWYSNKIPFTYDYADKDNDVFPYDSEHGTHVAGIIGGSSDTITGVAVDTQLVLMKVFPDFEQGAETDDILAALEDAVLLNVDCINMSLGTSCGFTREGVDEEKINEVYDKIGKSGISLITAASNSYSSSFGGAQGNTNFVTNPDSSTVGAPSTYESALSVASISGVKSSYLYANDSDVIFFTESNSITGKPNHFIDEIYAQQKLDENSKKTYEYVTVPGYGTMTDFQFTDVEGKIALVKRGSNTFENKAACAKNAGAVACIIYNNIEGTISMSMGKSDHIPTISITKEMGYLLAEKAVGTITISKKYTAGPFMSDFSSWGPTPNLELKPEITAHGGEIKSAIPGGGYDNLSGTSMASPNLCGIAVLIRQFLKDKFKSYTPQEIVVLANQMMMSTATIVLNEEGNPYSPRKQGAGLASLYNVVNTKAYLSVDGKDRTKLELKDDPKRTGEYNMEFNVVNISDEQVEYKLSLVGMTESVSTSDDEHVAEKGQILGGKATFKMSGAGSLKNNTLKVKAGETVKVSVNYKLTADDKKIIDTLFPNGMFVEGFVKLTAANDGIDLNVPFLAFYGDWRQAPMFDKTYYEVESEAHDESIDDEDKIKADYFATTPYGTYFYNYIIPLGTYLYDMPEGYQAIPASEELIAMSDTHGAIDGLSAIYGGLLRNAKTMTYTITDKVTGEVIKEYVDYNALKAHSNGGSAMPYFDFLNWKNPQFGYVNNRVYEFKMTGLLDYGDGGLTTNKNNTFKFDFTFDNEAPIIKSCTYEKEYDKSKKKDRYYLTMTVYDNHYVQSIYPVIFTNSSLDYTTLTDEPIPVMPVYGQKGRESKVRFEVTDLLDDVLYDAMITSSLGFIVDDYALNANLFICSLPGTAGDFKFTSNGEPDGSEKTIVPVAVGEAVDLTQYLSTTDPSVDENKDYLKYIEWTSSNEKIAVVKEGQVIGKSVGRANITATEYLGGKKASIMVNVTERAAEPAAADVNAESSEAQETSVEAPARNGGISVMSTNNVYDVNDALLKSVRFTYFDTKFAYTRSAQTSEIGETGDRKFVSALNSSVSMYPGEKIQLFYEMEPWYVTDKYSSVFKYESSDDSVAIVEQDGTITALKKGTARIRLISTDPTINHRATFTVSVNSEFVIDDSRTLVAYKGLGGRVVIPDDEGILYIGPYAFCLYDTDMEVELTEDDYDANKIPAANTSVTEVVIPDGVEEIQKYAFYNCSGLQSVEILGHVKYIRDYAFAKDEKLIDINLDKVYGVGPYAFYGCTALDNINISKTYSVAKHAFENCTSLSSVDLTSLRNTGESAFEGCSGLKSVTFAENTKLAARMFAGSGLTSVDIYERIEIPEYCFARCADLERVTLHNDLVAVGIGAFCRCDKLTDFKCAGVDRFEEQAFYLCPLLKEFTLPDCAVELGMHMFLDCKTLDTIKLGAKTVLSGIDASLFCGTALADIVVDSGNTAYSVAGGGKLLVDKKDNTILFAVIDLPETFNVDAGYADGVKIGNGAFGGANIKTLVVSSDKTEIGDYAFLNCNELTAVTLPASGTARIGVRAFSGCKKLETVNNLAAALDVDDYAFAETAITNATVGANAEYGEGVFFRSSIKTVTVGANASIGMGAFQGCKALTEVVMPTEGGVHFGASCFSGDAALRSIDMSKIDNTIELETFYGCTALTQAILTNVEYIGKYAFADCQNIATVEMPKVKEIGEYAFGKYETSGAAPKITTLTLPETLTSMGEGAFSNCAYLRTVTIRSKIEKIPDYAFETNVSLQRVTLPDSVKEIGEGAFGGCVYLSTINLEGVETIGMGAFLEDESLATVNLASAKTIDYAAFAQTALSGDITANNLETVGIYAFQNSAASISSFTAPKLRSIGRGAFMYNELLGEFIISEDLEEIGDGAFLGCTALRNFYYMRDGSVKTVTGEVNEHILIEDGVLYTRLTNGELMLSSIPAGKRTDTFKLKERTVAIAYYAGNANTYIKNIVLADSLKTIGNYAFDGCTALESVEFKSITAPRLESNYVVLTEDEAVGEGDPGYELLHKYLTVENDHLCYFTFKGLAGKFNPIKMILPSNGGLTGYDTLIYEVYFGKQALAEISDYVAMDANLVQFIDGAKEILRIETVTLADDKLITDTVAALEASTKKGTEYGYSEEEWKELVDGAYAAKQQLNALKGITEKPAGGKTEPSSGLAGWAIALIAVCASVVVLAVAAIVTLYVIKKNKGEQK